MLSKIPSSLKTWTDFKGYNILIGRTTCEVYSVNIKGRWFQCNESATDGCHGIFSKNKKFSGYVNRYWNQIMGCPKCNRILKADNHWHNRVLSLRDMIERLGKEYMIEQLEDAPAGMKRTIDWQRLREYAETGELDQFI